MGTRVNKIASKKEFHGNTIVIFRWNGHEFLNPFLKNRMKTLTTKTRTKAIPQRRQTPIGVLGRRPARSLSASYNKSKTFNGVQYTGMRVGRTHKWYYDKGEWKETKITPDLWEISYAVTKRRAGRAPEGSGVPVGTGYHWYILAHQQVIKLNANDYSTAMSGLKFKLAHKRAAKGSWSASAKAQRKKLAAFLQKMVDELKKSPIPIDMEFASTSYKGEAIPISETCHNGICDELDITLNNEHVGVIKCTKGGWKIDGIEDKKFVNAIGEKIALWYE
jgi:hypothetical protein